MPRRLRADVPGAIHHVVVQGNNRQAIVQDDVDRLALLGRLRLVGHSLEWQCHAYCLMDTHLHRVGTPKGNLGRGMQRLVGGYAFRFNRRHARGGHLFAGPYYSRAVEGEEHFIKACLYVVLNPVAAGLNRHPESWRWSSYQETLGSREAVGVVDPSLLLGTLAEEVHAARTRYVQLVEEALADVMAAPRVPG